MLDDAKQIEAFRILQAKKNAQSAQGVTDGPGIKSAADTKALALTSIKKALAYPAAVTALIGDMDSLASALTAAGAAADGLHGTLLPYNEVMELVNMSIGFDCYVKGSKPPLPADTAFPLVEGIAEKAKVTGIRAAVGAVVVTDIVAAMTSINTTLTPVAPVGGTGTPVAGTVSQTQIDDLSKAITAQAVNKTALTTATAHVTDLNSRAAASVQQAKTAFHDAVTVALIAVLLQDPRMKDAITALVPATVLAALA